VRYGEIFQISVLERREKMCRNNPSIGTLNLQSSFRDLVDPCAEVGDYEPAKSGSRNCVAITYILTKDDAPRIISLLS